MGIEHPAQVSGSAAKEELPREIASALQAHRHGHTLPQVFYTDPEVFTLDRERVLAKQWLFAGHAESIPDSGDYFLYEIFGESIIVIRGYDGEVRAFFNVCRHRGSRVCLSPRGNAKLLTCPYHAWVYQTDGTLRQARGMPDDYDKAANGLPPCQMRLWHGLIFINLSAIDDPGIADFDALMERLDPLIAANDPAQAQVAAHARYEMPGNWKLAVENFRECHHCVPAHPEYTQINHYVRVNEADRDAYAPHVQVWRQAWSGRGHIVGDYSGGSDQRQPYGGHSRPIRDGWLTASKDGRGLAPLMGGLQEYSGGLAFLFIGPLTYIYVANDHIVILQLVPLTATTSRTDITWLVRRGCQEGNDYRRDELVWLWDVTTRQDADLVGNNQLGVNSRAYQPGQYASTEDLLSQFGAWYTARLEG